jgi:hypothetical protein
LRGLLGRDNGRLPPLAWLAAFLAPLPAPTFAREVAPILYRNCAACHRPEGVAPFALLTYQDAAKRAALIATVTNSHYMPPWLPAEPRFQDERKLTPSEIAVLARWAEAGAPAGDLALAPAPPGFTGGWQLGTPSLEVQMAASFSVPADGPDLYQCFAIPAPSTESHYVRALEIRPGNPKVVHHALLFEDTTGTALRRDSGSGYPCFGTPGFLPARGLGGWTPGAIPFETPPGMPELLSARAALVLQIHYHPDGKPESDRSRAGLYFTSRKPERRAFDIPLGSNAIDIPPGERAYKVTDHFTIPVDVDAIAINPHAHYLCKEMFGYAILPDGARRTLLRIPDWNFDWQRQYTYAAPIRLPAGSRIEMEFTYDNSDSNPRNPNHPAKRVAWGPGSADEMAGLHIAVAPVHAADADELGDALWGKMMRALRGR